MTRDVDSTLSFKLIGELIELLGVSNSLLNGQVWDIQDEELYATRNVF